MNAYIFIIGLFVVCGIGATVWGALVIVRARRSLRWPTVAGVIEVSELNSADDAMLPTIEYAYSVADQSYRATLSFPGDITPTVEFSRSYVDKYPVGAVVTVYYDPDRPARATLEPGMGRGDWLILVLGIAATVTGLVLAGSGLGS